MPAPRRPSWWWRPWCSARCSSAGGSWLASGGGRGPSRVAEGLAPVRRQPPGRVRALRHDPARVDVVLDAVVVLLDLLEVRRVAERRCLEQVTRVAPQRRHLGELVAVALEVTVVDRVEASQRG